MASFTYDENLTSDRSYLRMRIGDTEEAYAKFYDEELDDILDYADDVDEAAGICSGILAHDPDRLVATKDATAGAFTLMGLMRMFASRSSEWHSK